ncbi:hypothetical protein LA76x_1858 [Lysobacter antibioticus]|uniref:Uncharacterized protein n=1 Tax=Lysobacter antibioticus TaxID=84531 RepID=A0A0S2F8Z0_LYSAN|nr:hypothetical protein LA76x_1858 [Lysobacter antibioticus]
MRIPGRSWPILAADSAAHRCQGSCMTATWGPMRAGRTGGPHRPHRPFVGIHPVRPERVDRHDQAVAVARRRTVVRGRPGHRCPHRTGSRPYPGRSHRQPAEVLPDGENRPSDLQREGAGRRVRVRLSARRRLRRSAAPWSQA